MAPLRAAAAAPSPSDGCSPLDRPTAVDEERRHIADALHDGPVQDLASIGIRLGTFRSGLTDDGQRRTLEQLERSVRHALGGIRSLIVDLSPPEVADDLASTLRTYVAETLDGVVEVDLDVDGVGPLPPPIAVAAFRIVQQALSNVRAHASATTVQVGVAEEDGALVGVVVDDGIGAPAEVLLAPQAGHLGLRRMHEHAEAAHGWVRVASGADGGVLVRFSLPLDAEPAELAE